MLLRLHDYFIAELRRAKRASGAPWVRKFGKPMKPKKFRYRVSVRPPAPTDFQGGGGESQGNPTGGRRMSSYHITRTVEVNVGLYL